MPRLADPTPGQLPPGAERNLVLAVLDAFRAAGSPSFRLLEVEILNNAAYRGTASRETISKLLRGDFIPRWEKVDCIVRQLAKMSNRDPDAEAKRFLDLWNKIGNVAETGKQPVVEELAFSSVSSISSSDAIAKKSGIQVRSSELKFVDNLECIVVIRKSPEKYYTENMDDREVRDSISARTRQERNRLVGRLAAILSREFGPADVKPKYSSEIEFPGGAIKTEICSKLQDHGYISSFWFKLSIVVEPHQVDVLRLLQGQIGDNGLEILSSAYRFSGRPDLVQVAQALHARGIHLKERTEDQIILDAGGDVGTEIAVREGFGFTGTEVHLAGYEVTKENAMSMFQKVVAYLGFRR